MALRAVDQVGGPVSDRKQDSAAQKTPAKVTGEKTAGARRPPWETLSVSECLVRARLCVYVIGTALAGFVTP